MNSRIKLTLEIQKEGSLPSLDIKLMKNNYGNKLERTVYRKHCKYNNIILFDCNSPFSYKITAYIFYTKRAFDACTDKYLEEEVNVIKQIDLENGFPPQFINSLVNRAKQSRPKTKNFE